jgi:hypothetical protein
MSGVVLRRRWWSRYPRPVPRKGWVLTRMQVVLPSSIPGADFVAELRIWFRSNTEGKDSAFRTRCLVEDTACRAAADVAEKFLVQYCSAAEAALNGTLSRGCGLPNGSAIDWVASGRLRAEQESVSIGREVSRSLREGQTRRKIEVERIEGLLDLLNRPGFAAAWWADSHPQLLPYLGDKSFQILLQESARSLEATGFDVPQDPDAVAIRSFLSLISTSKERAAIAQVLRVVLDCFPDGLEEVESADEEGDILPASGETQHR